MLERMPSLKDKHNAQAKPVEPKGAKGIIKKVRTKK